MQSSVPHLKARLQLQQAIMKELIQRQEREKSGSTPSTPSQPLQSSQLSSLVNQTSAQPVSSQSQTVPQIVTQFPTGSTVSKPIMISAVKNSTTTTPSGVQLQNLVQAGQLKSATPNTPTAVSPRVSLPGASPSSSGFVLQPALIQQLNLQLPKNVREQIAKLPPEQQKIVYLTHFKRLQEFRQQQLHAKQNMASSSSGATAASSVTNAQTVRAKQEQLVKAQQVPLVMGNRGTVNPVRKSLPKTQSSLTSSSAVKRETGESSFASMKLVASNSSSSVSTLSPSKGKKSKGKDIALDANE